MGWYCYDDNKEKLNFMSFEYIVYRRGASFQNNIIFNLLLGILDAYSRTKYE